MLPLNSFLRNFGTSLMVIRRWWPSSRSWKCVYYRWSLLTPHQHLPEGGQCWSPVADMKVFQRE